MTDVTRCPFLCVWRGDLTYPHRNCVSPFVNSPQKALKTNDSRGRREHYGHLQMNSKFFRINKFWKMCCIPFGVITLISGYQSICQTCILDLGTRAALTNAWTARRQNIARQSLRTLRLARSLRQRSLAARGARRDIASEQETTRPGLAAFATRARQKLVTQVRTWMTTNRRWKNGHAGYRGASLHRPIRLQTSKTWSKMRRQIMSP